MTSSRIRKSKSSNLETVLPTSLLDELQDRFSSLRINYKECGSMDPAVLGTDTAIGYLGDETAVTFQVIHNSPISLVNNTFFRRTLYGRTIPWINGQKVFFPEWEKCKPCCYLPMTEDQSEDHNYGVEVAFRKTQGGMCRVRCWGIVEIPIIIGNIPLRIPCLLVDHLPIHRTFYKAPMPVMLILARLFNGHTVPLRLDETLLKYRCRSAPTITTFVETTTHRTTLEVIVDVACTDTGRGPSCNIFGVGVFFGKDSVYNISLGLQSADPNWNSTLQLRGVLQALYAIRNMCINTFTMFDFSDVVIKIDSTYIVRGMTENVNDWRKTDWKDAHGNEIDNASLWRQAIEAQQDSKRSFLWKYVDRDNIEQANRLSLSAVIGVQVGLDWKILVNETCLTVARQKILQGGQRPGKYFEACSIEGGMCRRSAPNGFMVATCCQCQSGKKDWSTFLHF